MAQLGTKEQLSSEFGVSGFLGSVGMWDERGVGKGSGDLSSLTAPLRLWQFLGQSSPLIQI
jgi:hypothetical protein